MLPRSEFVKPVARTVFAESNGLTAVQEFKQHLAGESLLSATLQSLRKGLDGAGLWGLVTDGVRQEAVPRNVL